MKSGRDTKNLAGYVAWIVEINVGKRASPGYNRADGVWRAIAQ